MKVLDINLIRTLQTKPPLFERGEPLFWDDPHISSQMLKAHLNPETDAASRRPETIDKMVTWIAAQTGIVAGDCVLDLGCGPGLYASRLAEHGVIVTGVDYSKRSIDYAREYAETHGLTITYRYENYIDLADENLYDAALLIYGDFCPLDPDERGKLLGNIHRALKPGGWFVLDVTTREGRKKRGVKNNWYAAGSGFWRPGPHLVLEEGFDYPDEKIYLDQYTVIDEDGSVRVFRNWFQDYNPEMITAELEAGGFMVQGLWGDLTGAPLTAVSEWIGVIARSF